MKCARREGGLRATLRPPVLNAYDLAARGLTLADLPRLTAREMSALVVSPEFWARPGQLWEPGPEQITVHEGGRGSGKSYAGQAAVLRAARDPERWGGFALMAGPDPQAVESDMLMGASGLLTIGKQVAAAGLGPGFTYNPSKLRVTFEAPRGGGSGLTVLLRASSKPHGGRGPNVGLAWLDEFGVWYHRKTDEQGTNLWRAVRPAIRAGRPTSHIIITMTPSRQPEVRALQRDAERPECAGADGTGGCKGRYLAEHGTFDGEAGTEPWRLPRSPQRRLHPLLETRTTEAVRECPQCGDEVVATVRTVFFATTDNPHTDAPSRDRARRALSSGQAADRMEFAPVGEADSNPRGSLVREQDVRKVDVDVAPGAPDRWQVALAALGIAASDVVVFVDPAVTSKDTSDETGLGAAGARWTRDDPSEAEAREQAADARRQGDGDGRGHGLEGGHAASVGGGVAWRQCVGLQDWSVRPGEVDGAPSAVWAPRAYWLALLWGARRICVEVNQGGDEVLAGLRALVARGMTEAEAAARLAREFPAAGTAVTPAHFGGIARRVAQAARAVRVEEVSRRADKVVRWEWYGAAAGRGEQAVACLPWTGGARAWSPVVAQLTGLERPREGQALARGPLRRDRADWLVAAAEVLLGVRETAAGRVAPAQAGWMSQANPGLLG